MESHYNNDEYQVHFEPRDVHAEAIKTFLVAADALDHSGDFAQAELRYTQALRQAELAFGGTSDHYKRVLNLLAVFYRNHERDQDARVIELKLSKMAREAAADEPVGTSNLQSRFLRKKKVTNEELVVMNRIVLPPEIRKSCQILGMAVDEDFTVDDVLKAWKRRIVAGSVHPDLGGENEHSVMVNTSKDVLIRWLESRLQSRLGLGRHLDFHTR